jgi:precorrin-6B methylase 2
VNSPYRHGLVSPTSDAHQPTGSPDMRIEYHRTMLADQVRNAAFHAALKTVIVPGKTTVADIGCGTGLLGFMAARLGAKRVYMLEKAEIVDIARKLARHNGIRNIEIVPAHSTEVDPPKRVDVVVSETLGNYPFEENIIETLADARDRYLEPGGTLIPRAVAQFVVPVTAERHYRELITWDEVGFGLDFAPARAMGLNNIYVRTFAPADLLDRGRSAVRWDMVELHMPAKTTRSGEAVFQAASPTTIYGLALWWTATLVQGIEIATGPVDPKTHWEQLYLPALEPLRLEPGQKLKVRLRSTTSYADGTNVTWQLALEDARGRQLTRQSLDLEKGFVP